MGVFDHRNTKWSANDKLVHPDSSHLLKDYAFWHFNHGNYSFSSLGEYKFHMAAVKPLFEESEVPSVDDNHSVFIFPDRIWLRNITSKDIPGVMQFIQKPNSDIEVLMDSVTSDAVLHDMDKLTIIVGGTHASTVGAWFRSAATERGLGDKVVILEGCHANADSPLASAHVVVLPVTSGTMDERWEIIVSEDEAGAILTEFVEPKID